MSTSTLRKPRENPAREQSRKLPPETADGRDLRAQSQSLWSILTSRRFVLRAVNGLVLAALDLLLLFASLMIALRVKSLLTSEATSLRDSFDYTVNVLPLAALVMLLLFYGDGLYRRRNMRPGAQQILGSLFKVMVVTLVFALIDGLHFQSYYIFWSTFTVAAVLIIGARMLYDRASERVEQSFSHQRQAVIIGSGRQIDAVAVALQRAPVRRIVPIGFISQDGSPERQLRNLGTLDELEDHFDTIDEVIVADPTFPTSEAVMLVDRCHRGGVEVRLAPTTMEILRADVSEFVPGESLPLFEIRPPVFEGVAFVTKRIFDIIVASLLIVLLSPLLLLTALLVKLTSRGPVFFLSPRPGLGGEPFKCIKFRTMVTNADALQDELEKLNEADGAIFKIADDPRLTKIGKPLRRWSIDELPQLFNVVKGEMSLVGPRPLPRRDYNRLEAWHKKRYLVLPGITGLWQVSGRSDLDFDDLVRLDFLYLERWSVFLDLSIIIKTIPAVLRGRGAF